MQPPLELLTAISQCPPSVRCYIEELQQELAQLLKENDELRVRLNQNPSNSHKPPSCDLFIKPKSLREKTGRKPGGQPGHRGYTLLSAVTPDVITYHKPCECGHCGASLSGEGNTTYTSRQVIDVEIRQVVTEHRAVEEKCSVCGEKTKAKFPQGVSHYLQYGPVYNSIVVCLNQGNYVPFQRLAKLSEDIFQIPVSTATLVRIVQQCAGKLTAPIKYIKEQLIHSSVAHFDETGVRVNGKPEWLHSASTNKFTYVEAHPKRGNIATDDIGVLPSFQGTAVHDGWKPYNKYQKCDHALCNAHILRELNGIADNYKQKWPEEMKNLLVAIKRDVDAAGGFLPPDKADIYAIRYDEVLVLADEENPIDMKAFAENKTRGRVKRSKARNLIDRMKLYKSDILKFMYKEEVPFDNNLAERDIRMSKLHQKVSGGFRSHDGKKAFNIIRSYISSAAKHGTSMFESVHLAMAGKPLFSAEQPARGD